MNTTQKNLRRGLLLGLVLALLLTPVLSVVITAEPLSTIVCEFGDFDGGCGISSLQAEPNLILAYDGGGSGGEGGGG